MAFPFPSTLGRLAVIRDANLAELLALAAEPRADTTMRGERNPDAPWGSYRVENGAAIIPVRGVLVTDGAFVGGRWGVTSYEGLRAELRRAAEDPKVSKIVLAINSPGGMVAGIDSAAAAIGAARARKPVVAMVEGMAASGGYWLAAQAHEIVVSPLSEVGSIGVIATHVDASAALAGAGLDVSLIHSGAHKVDGNPFEPLPDNVRADMQADVDRLRNAFAAAIAAGRGARLSADAALATEAQVYPAAEAVRIGLADRVGTLEDVLGSSPASRASYSGSSVAAVAARAVAAAPPAPKTIDTAGYYARRAAATGHPAPTDRPRLASVSGLDTFAEAIYARRNAGSAAGRETVETIGRADAPHEARAITPPAASRSSSGSVDAKASDIYQRRAAQSKRR